MKIMIGGGFDDENQETSDGISSFAQSLARQVILQDHQLRCGNLTQLDAVVIEAACQEQDKISKTDRVISYVSAGVSTATSLGEVRNSANPNWDSMSGRKPRVPEPIEEADVLILIGGYEGSFTAANWARQSNTPILPVGTFGMAADDILEDELNENGRTNRLSKDDLRKLRRAASTLADEAILDDYAAEVIRLAEKAALSREVFIVMSFSEEPSLKTEFLSAVKEACKEYGFEAERIDQRPEGNSFDIVKKIHQDIEACGFVVADLTNERPNVYYEIGYARGLGKPVILTNAEGGKVHFDIAGQSRIEWTGGFDLKNKLGPELEALATQFGISG